MRRAQDIALAGLMLAAFTAAWSVVAVIAAFEDLAEAGRRRRARRRQPGRPPVDAAREAGWR